MKDCKSNCASCGNCGKKVISCDGCGIENLKNFFERRGLIFCKQQCFEKSFPDFALFSETDEEFQKFARIVKQKLNDDSGLESNTEKLINCVEVAPKILWPNIKIEDWEVIIRTNNDSMYDYTIRTAKKIKNKYSIFVGKTFSIRIFIDKYSIKMYKLNIYDKALSNKYIKVIFP